MKNYAIFVSLMLLSGWLSAQTGAKKYVLIEHFTNSNCSVCASRNPGMFNLIGQAQYADDVHHVSIHPVFPYPQCVFYQANTSENTAWTGLYPVQGTPTIVLNGATQSPSNPLLSENKLISFLNQTSPLALQVTESGSGTSRQVNIKAKSFGDIPAGSYNLFVAIVEKTINQQTPNGEAVHHNVFRKMITAVAGNPFTPPAIGETLEFNFDYTLANNWKPEEVYVVAFVKETTTKAVLNSGTRFDPQLSSVPELSSNAVKISPNPATDLALLELGDDRVQSLEVFAANGQRLSLGYEQAGNLLSIATHELNPGIYFVKVVGEKGLYTGKFVKQ